MNDEDIRQIENEFPLYRKIKERFLILLEKRFGVFETVEEDTYYIKFWGLTIPVRLSSDFNVNTGKPKPGDDVLLLWKQNSISEILSVCRNMMEV